MEKNGYLFRINGWRWMSHRNTKLGGNFIRSNNTAFSLNGKIKRGEEAVILESSKAAIEYISPLSGKILSVNSALEKNTDLLNSDAEGKGWLYEIEFSDPKELEELITK